MGGRGVHGADDCFFGGDKNCRNHDLSQNDGIMKCHKLMALLGSFVCRWHGACQSCPGGGGISGEKRRGGLYWGGGSCLPIFFAFFSDMILNFI